MVVARLDKVLKRTFLSFKLQLLIDCAIRFGTFCDATLSHGSDSIVVIGLLHHAQAHGFKRLADRTKASLRLAASNTNSFSTTSPDSLSAANSCKSF